MAMNAKPSSTPTRWSWDVELSFSAVSKRGNPVQCTSTIRVDCETNDVPLEQLVEHVECFAHDTRWYVDGEPVFNVRDVSVVRPTAPPTPSPFTCCGERGNTMERSIGEGSVEIAGDHLAFIEEEDFEELVERIRKIRRAAIDAYGAPEPSPR